MVMTKRSMCLMILTIYMLTLFCGVGVFVSNPILDGVRSLMQLALPLLVTASLLIDAFKNKTFNKEDKVSLIIIGLNIVWFILSIIFGINIGRQSITGIVNFTNILCILYLVSHIKLNDEQALKIKQAFFISAFIASLYGIVQYIFQIDLNIFENAKYPGIFGRINSTFFLPTLYDKYMVLIFGIICCILLDEDRILYRILFVLTGINVVLTFSRGGFIALVFVLVMFIILSIIKKRYKNLILSLVFVIAAFLIPGVNYLFQLTANYVYDKVHMPEVLRVNILPKGNNVKDDETQELPPKEVDIKDDSSLIYREYYNSVGIGIVKEYPILGVGLNNYSYLYNKQNVLDFVKNKELVAPNSKYMYPHNGYVQLSAEIGIVGTVLFLTYLFYMLYVVLKDHKVKYYSILLIILFLLGNFTESLIHNKQYMYIFVLLYAYYANKNIYIDKVKKTKKR